MKLWSSQKHSLTQPFGVQPQGLRNRAMDPPGWSGPCSPDLGKKTAHSPTHSFMHSHFTSLPSDCPLSTCIPPMMGSSLSPQVTLLSLSGQLWLWVSSSWDSLCLHLSWFWTSRLPGSFSLQICQPTPCPSDSSSCFGLWKILLYLALKTLYSKNKNINNHNLLCKQTNCTLCRVLFVFCFNSYNNTVSTMLLLFPVSQPGKLRQGELW